MAAPDLAEVGTGVGSADLGRHAHRYALRNPARGRDAGQVASGLPYRSSARSHELLNEEFQFRNVPLATLPGLLFGKAQSLLLTAVYFGLEHYYGNPPALSGVLLAAFLGYLLGKSMLETGGSRWAWLIHWLQNVIIFSFLVMSWGT